MKVLHAIYSMDPKMGGTVEALLQLIAASEGTGQTHEVVCLDAPDIIKKLALPVTIHALGPTKRFYGNTPKLPKWLNAHLQNYGIAVIHGCWQYHGLATFRACKNLNIPYFQYTHGMMDPWFKKTYPLKHLKKWLYWPWAEYRILKNAARVIFTCEEERELAKQSFWLYQVTPAIIPLGIEPPPFDLAFCQSKWTEKFPQFEGKRTIVYLSRIHEKKGVDLLIEAVKTINHNKQPQLEQEEVTMVIVGPCSNPEWLETLKKESSTIHPKGPIKEIVWVDMMRDELKWGALAHAEAFILPSHQENFGIVVAEALACSTPVLISNKVNIWKEVGNAGLVENDDLEGTIQLIEKWLKLSNQNRKEFRTNALAVFTENFTMKTNADRLFKLIDSITQAEQ